MIEAFEKDCPVCKHKTLMKGLTTCAPVMSQDEVWDMYYGKPTRFYCYVCGTSFRQVTTTELVKEGEDGKV